ncbi:helix-turn-helix domain-containing protein [Poritiphilus flavus]|uniref:Helix-turn-helix domain-containing protein n=1 Tax=Poritiphilus flavus TaxID=2697053 RepID=A0A6L9EHC7_9FLAO|nr:helix-turn-helix domain-containing protein [Poritiphilus flavus]NAS13888.1 helix-turn-helix domain-containing protein [Poritiphilus flavus]
MKAQKIYNSISEFFHSINLEIEQDFDFTIHSLDRLHGDKAISSPFFRTNYVAFLIIESGKGHYTIDEHWFELKPMSFYFTLPGHLKSFTIEENWKGYMLTFSLEFLKSNYPGSVEQDFPFLLKETVPVMYLQDQDYARINRLCEVFIQEYNGNSAFKKRILANQLVTFLFQTKELLLSHQATISMENRPAEIVKSFQLALNKNLLDITRGKAEFIWNVQDYANKLNMHPNYLSSSVKSQTGKTAKQWIDERIISEAKSLLKNTDMSVSEIAYSLTYEDSSNFSRFFKKKTGLTPANYRNS